MISLIKKVIEKKIDGETRRYFYRFGKGDYGRRFLIKLDKGNKLKLRTSFELANDLVRLVDSLKSIKFSGKILSRDKVPGKEGRKKGGVMLYEVSECNVKEFENPYYYLLDAADSEVVLKIKKSLPKPGKDELKVDENFCSLDLDLKYWPAVKEAFFWDVPECKKVIIEHNLLINEIIMPKGEKDPVKIRENSIRKGKLLRKMNVDGKDIVKEYDLEV